MLHGIRRLGHIAHHIIPVGGGQAVGGCYADHVAVGIIGVFLGQAYLTFDRSDTAARVIGGVFGLVQWVVLCLDQPVSRSYVYSQINIINLNKRIFP